LRRANTSANAPATNDDSPMIGPESELPVKGSAPVVEPGVVAAAVMTLDVVGDVEPRLPVLDVVVVVWTVEPSVSIGVLDTVVVEGSVVVDDSMVVLVVASVVLVVPSVVDVVAPVVDVVASVVVVVSVPHAPPSEIVTPFSLLIPSGHDTNASNRTSPVRLPGIVVVRVMALFAGTSLAPTIGNVCEPLSVALSVTMCMARGVLLFVIVQVIT